MIKQIKEISSVSESLILALLLAAVVLWLRLGNIFPEWLSIVVSVWIFLVGPVVLFVTARLAREEIHFEDPRGITGTLSRLMVGTPLGCFGIIFLVSGLAVVGFAVWSAIEKKDFSLLKNVPGVLIFVGMAFGWFVLRPASCVLRPASCGGQGLGILRGACGDRFRRH